MSHLLALSVGPVQEFIAAARRTRDLWFGSYLLSEISRAAAKAVEGQGGRLIFPASTDPNKARNVANVILAELDAGDPKEVAARAKEAARIAKEEAQQCWLAFARRARDEVSVVLRPETWEGQENDVLEFDAAWASYEPGNYKEGRARVMRLLAGRKSCRDFLPQPFPDVGRPKSSLDGQRPTVLLGPKPGESRETYRKGWPRQLRLSPGEQLDVIGITKRLGRVRGEAHPSYPSVARVAADAWVRGVRGEQPFKNLRDACERLARRGLLNRVREARYQDFPYEGTVVYKDRHTDLRKELGLDEHDLDEVAKALKALGGEPNPYLAVLVADGDRMGETISRLDSPAKHREFSKDLAGFADEAGTIVSDHNGVLVYAGGDDVLAFLPVDRCLACAWKLHEAFGERLKGYGSPTLSVGLAVGHFMENLEDLLDYGRDAEKHAKRPRADDRGQEPRDGLAVHLHKRGGAPIQVRGGWKERPDERITEYALSIGGDGLPGGLAYELRTLADLYAGWKTETEEERRSVESALRQDVKRLLSKKQPGGGKTAALDVGAVRDAPSLKAFAAELLVARMIAAALRQAGEAPS